MSGSGSDSSSSLSLPPEPLLLLTVLPRLEPDSVEAEDRMTIWRRVLMESTSHLQMILRWPLM